MARMWIKKSIYTVKIVLIAPTLGGPAPPDLYIGGAGGGAPWPPQFLLLWYCSAMTHLMIPSSQNTSALALQSALTTVPPFMSSLLLSALSACRTECNRRSAQQEYKTGEITIFCRSTALASRTSTVQLTPCQLQ